MPAAALWPADPSSSSSSPCAQAPDSVEPSLPVSVRAAVWRAHALGSPVSPVVASGWPELDRELPGGGWPCRALTELLAAQPSVLEWRLLGPALRQVVAADRTVVLVGPPKDPHLPGLAHEGLDERHLVWISADTPAERLWCTEQLVKANAAGALLAWLPQARPEQIRRLQVNAQVHEGLVFLFRPLSAADEASAAPLRVEAGLGPHWSLRVRIRKRRGAMHEAPLVLPSVPGGLQSVLTPRLDRPTGSQVSEREVAADVVGSNVIALRARLAHAH